MDKSILNLPPMERLVKLAKSQTALAKHLGASKQTINQVVLGNRPLDPKWIPAAVEFGQGYVAAHELRPDLARVFLKDFGIDVDSFKRAA